MTAQQQEVKNFPISLYIVTKHGKPALEMRTLTSDNLAMKIIIERAFNKQPIIIFPIFRDELKATASLVNKKILEYDKEKEVYRFII